MSMPVILIMKPILVFPAPSRWKHQNRFFESPPTAGFQKTDFYNENYCEYALIT